MKTMFNKQSKFAFDKFPEATAIDHLTKLEHEVNELKSVISSVSSKDLKGFEFADCLLCLFGAAAKAGFTYDDLVKYSAVKQVVNKHRDWVKLPDGTYQHK